MQRPPASRRQGSGPQPVISYAPIAALARKASDLDALDRALRQTLPAPLRDHVRFAQRRGTRLIFLAPTPAWASRLRLMQTRILASARSIGVEASSVAVKVAPLPPPIVEMDRSKPLSVAAARHLEAAANNQADPELRRLFLQLARVASRKTSPAEGNG